MKAILVVFVFWLLVMPAAGAAEPSHAQEIKQTITEWGKEQIADGIKSIFTPREDEWSERDRLSFGQLLTKLQLVIFFGWLMGLMVYGRIASLIRMSTIMGCIQCVAKFIST
jgi:hypothetical protein